jgi:hypothetical protein
MKLILCTRCQDVFKVVYSEERHCQCGRSYGRCSDKDGINAWYSGKHAVPLGFANSSLAQSVTRQPEQGMGAIFEAFVIPSKCPTFTNLGMGYDQ